MHDHTFYALGRRFESCRGRNTPGQRHVDCHRPNRSGPMGPLRDPYRAGLGGGDAMSPHDCPRCGKRPMVPEFSLCERCNIELEAELVPQGQRNQTLRNTAFSMGRDGATNHEILARLSLMSEAMDKYTDARNLFEKWTRLLAMVREVRSAGVTVEKAGAWCNCQAIPGTLSYPGPWHPKGDSIGCLKFGVSGASGASGGDPMTKRLEFCRACRDERDVIVPAEFIIWGKLTDPEFLGPRCWHHTQQVVGVDMYRIDQWAIFDLRPFMAPEAPQASCEAVVPSDPQGGDFAPAACGAPTEWVRRCSQGHESEPVADSGGSAVSGGER